MKIHPFPHSIFETTRSGFIQILYHCSVSWKITPLYLCSSKLEYFGEKELIEKTLSGWVKVQQILHIIFESKSQFFFKLCITLHCHDLSKRNLSKWKILDFQLLMSNFITFVLWFVLGPKKCKGTMFHDTEEWCKIWRKINLWLRIWQIFTRVLESFQIETLMGSFYPK